MQAVSTAEFFVNGELERSSSGKTIKIYIYDYGKRRFIGQVTCNNLRNLLNGSQLKVDIQKYRNTNQGETSATTPTTNR